jgi:hypothetical protein
MKQNLQPSFHIIATFSKQTNLYIDKKIFKQVCNFEAISIITICSCTCQYILWEDNNDGFIMW